MPDIENVIRGIKHESRNSGKCGHYCPEEYAAKCPYDPDGLCIIHWGADAIALLKEQEPKILKIKEMEFLEMAVFIETNGELEGKGTDLFLAIPYIYAVSQNTECGYLAFVDGNTDVYDLEAHDYGKTWRCWSARPTDEQRKAVKWE